MEEGGRLIRHFTQVGILVCSSSATFFALGLRVSYEYVAHTRSTMMMMLRARSVARHLARPSLVRTYRGEAGDGVRSASDREEELLRVALPRSASILQRHQALPDLEAIPPASLDPSQSDLEIRRKRLIYRAKQRGWLEVDLLLGTWASENVPLLKADELDQFEDFVNEETIDIYNIITLRVDIPESKKTLTGDSIVERIQQWARESPLGKADPDTYKAVKTSNNLI